MAGTAFQRKTYPVLQKSRVIHVHGALVPECQLGHIEADAAPHHLHTSHWDWRAALAAVLPHTHSAGIHDLQEISFGHSMLRQACCSCMAGRCENSSQLQC